MEKRDSERSVENQQQTGFIDFSCYAYGGPNHYARDCPKKS